MPSFYCIYLSEEVCVLDDDLLLGVVVVAEDEVGLVALALHVRQLRLQRPVLLLDGGLLVAHGVLGGYSVVSGYFTAEINRLSLNFKMLCILKV